MKLALITDAWEPQTNGVVTTFAQVNAELEKLGIEVLVVEPRLFPTLPLPSYPEIRVACSTIGLKRILLEASPDMVHVGTEGPLGLQARLFLTRKLIPFTTSLHTKFPEYANQRWGVPLSVGYRYLRWFHRPASRTMVTTPSHKRELESWGLSDLVVWGRGVDTQTFRPADRPARSKPQLLYVGRVAVEKNLQAFLELSMDAEKVVVGDGPAHRELQAQFPDVRWLGYRKGRELVTCYAEADVFVFPSLTDTFGLVMLEAMACGTPVAAYPVTGPKDVVIEGVNGALDQNLRVAVQRALALDRNRCRRFAEAHGWACVARRLTENLVRADWRRPGAVGDPVSAAL